MASRWVDRVGIAVDRRADLPLGVQLAWALGGAIRSGALPPGDRLPPLRELAAELGVNLNTLRAVYAKLEAEGLIETRHGSGTYVTHAPGARELDAAVATAAQAAHDAGLDPRDLAAALYVAPAPRTPDADAARRRALREEIAVLERVLSGIAGLSSTATGSRRGGPQLLSLTELEAARDDLVARIGAASRPPEPEPAPAPKRAKAKAKAAAKRAPRLGPATA